MRRLREQRLARVDGLGASGQPLLCLLAAGERLDADAGRIRLLDLAGLLALAFAISSKSSRDARAQNALPDLIVASMSIELETGNSCSFSSTVLGVRVSVSNIGGGHAGAFVVDVNGGQQTVGAGLLAGSGATLWYAGYSFGQNIATVDATFLVAESDETNNQLSPAIPLPTLPATCTATATSTNIATYTPTPTATNVPPTPTGILTNDSDGDVVYDY